MKESLYLQYGPSLFAAELWGEMPVGKVAALSI
jgi:hypothetical protein